MDATSQFVKEIEPSWKRPEGPLNVWKTVELLGQLENQSKTNVRVSIQEVPNNKTRHQEAIDLMIKYYLAEEPVSLYLNESDDLEGIADLRVIWNYCLRQGVVVGAYKLGKSDELLELVGVNMLYVQNSETLKEINTIIESFKSVGQKKTTSVMASLLETSEEKFRKQFEEGTHIGGWGIAVVTKFRGHKLGMEMFKARDSIGQMYEIPLSETIFTSIASQISAQRAGYVPVLEIDYDNIVDKNGEPHFPGIKEKTLKIMAKRLTD